MTIYRLIYRTYRCLQFLGAKPDFFSPLEVLQNINKEIFYFMQHIFSVSVSALTVWCSVFVKFHGKFS